ncbi:MAG: CPBP family intramembrane metalloprotease [Bacteroidetes bacterium]|nr:CPBP family intramembrane metalloprotease [Bacteroidota bacterium]
MNRIERVFSCVLFGLRPTDREEASKRRLSGRRRVTSRVFYSWSPPPRPLLPFRAASSVPSSSSAAERTLRSAYWTATRTGTYGFLSTLPLLVAYEVMIAVANYGSGRPVRIGADVWMKQIVALLGGPAPWVLAGVVVAIGIGILVYERGSNIPLRARYFTGIIAESAVYALVVAGIVGQMVAAVFAAWPSPQMAHDLWTQLALSIGAGLYEELVFRVLLVGGLFLLFRWMFSGETTAYVAAAVIGAGIFSLVHYVGALGDPFALDSFTFRFLFGLALNVLFLLRGFGVAAWTHALYDIYFTLGVFG